MITNRILFVDDDANVLAAIKGSLDKKFQIETSLSGDDSLSRLANEGPFAVVIADMEMPGMNGIEFLSKVRQQAPETVRLMLTGNTDQKTAADAVNQGHVFSFLTKPSSRADLERVLTNALAQYRLVTAERELLEQTLNGAVKVLTELMSINDPEAFQRAQRLREQMKVIVAGLKLPRPWELEVAAMLSEIGYIALPANLITKARLHDQLSGPERDILARVPSTGAALLENIPRLGAVADIIRYQRKNFDGSGYPSDPIAGEAIPIGARILRVLTDLLDGESLKRSPVKAFHELRRRQGIYDPQVLEGIASCFNIESKSDALALVHGESIPAQVRDLAVEDLLAEDIQLRDGTLLVPKNSRITAALLTKLRNFAELGLLSEPILITR